MTEYSLIIPDHKEEGYGVQISVTDISYNRSEVTLLVETCNRAKVSVEQFPDVLDNFLSDYNSF